MRELDNDLLLFIAEAVLDAARNLGIELIKFDGECGGYHNLTEDEITKLCPQIAAFLPAKIQGYEVSQQAAAIAGMAKFVKKPEPELFVVIRGLDGKDATALFLNVDKRWGDSGLAAFTTRNKVFNFMNEFSPGENYTIQSSPVEHLAEEAGKYGKDILVDPFTLRQERIAGVKGKTDES